MIERELLTPYDEFPVHQASRPFSYIPSTDYNWDDGYFFAVFNPDLDVFLSSGMRVNPNSDMIGGYAILAHRGRQTTVRFSRSWRRDFSLRIGPFRYDLLEPLKTWKMVLEPNESGLSFDLLWEGASPPVLEEHHIATNRHRRSTDQSRYAQAGRGSGQLTFRGETFEVDPQTWGAARDHSWGLYSERPPLAPVSTLLPPRRRSARAAPCGSGPVSPRGSSAVSSTRTRRRTAETC